MLLMKSTASYKYRIYSIMRRTCFLKISLYFGYVLYSRYTPRGIDPSLITGARLFYRSGRAGTLTVTWIVLLLLPL